MPVSPWGWVPLNQVAKGLNDAPAEPSGLEYTGWRQSQLLMSPNLKHGPATLDEAVADFGRRLEAINVEWHRVQGVVPSEKAEAIRRLVAVIQRAEGAFCDLIQASEAQDNSNTTREQ